MGSYQRFEFFEHYDLEVSQKVTLSLSFIANQFIHSLLFKFSWNDAEKPDGVYFVSEKDSLHRCLHVSLTEIARVFRLVANSWATTMMIERDEFGRKFLTAIR